MRTGNLNLASRPFANQLPVVRVTVVLGLLAVALLALNATLYSSYFAGAGQEAREELGAVEAEIRTLAADLEALQAQLRGYDFDAHNEQVAFLNQKIAERTFGWSRLFEDIDAVLPANVRLERMVPRIGGARGHPSDAVALTLNGFARSDEGLLELIDALFEHPRFTDPSPSRVADREGQQQFALTVVYLPGVATEPAASDEEEPEGEA